MYSGFYGRVRSELKVAVDEVEFWNDLMARGVVSPSHAEGYLSAANNIIATKRFVLGIS